MQYHYLVIYVGIYVLTSASILLHRSVLPSFGLKAHSRL